jgi:hypothetical protein
MENGHFEQVRRCQEIKVRNVTMTHLLHPATFYAYRRSQQSHQNAPILSSIIHEDMMFSSRPEIKQEVKKVALPRLHQAVLVSAFKLIHFQIASFYAYRRSQQSQNAQE